MAARDRAAWVEVLIDHVEEANAPQRAVVARVSVGRLQSMVWARRATAELNPQALGDDPRWTYRNYWATAHLERDSIFIARIDGTDVPWVRLEFAAFSQFRTTRVCVIADQDPNRRRYLVIPCWEIVRYFYSARGMLSNQLFTGALEPTSLLNQVAKVCFDGIRFEPTSYILRNSDRDDILYDRYAAHQACEIARRCIVNYRREGVAAIEAVPPFMGNVCFTGHGASQRIGDVEVFVLFRIISARALDDFPFRKPDPLSVDWGDDDTTLCPGCEIYDDEPLEMHRREPT